MKPNPDAFLVPVTADEVRRERRKARALRHSQWWKNRTSRGLCAHCGGRFPACALTMDHLVPIIRGGKSTRGNVVPSCKPCNTARKHSLPFAAPDGGGAQAAHSPEPVERPMAEPEN